VRQNRGGGIGSNRKPVPAEALKVHASRVPPLTASCGKLQAPCGEAKARAGFCGWLACRCGWKRVSVEALIPRDAMKPRRHLEKMMSLQSLGVQAVAARH
jgi:hypothetical protein